MRRRPPSLERERALWRVGREVVAGVDEVGRGPLAGPVVAAAVVFPPDCRPIRGLTDSKLLTPARRLRLADEIHARALAVAVGAASVREIDRLNIRRATIVAIRRAVARLPAPPQLVLLDGLPLPELEIPHEAVVDGDLRCHSIAAASVVAKVIRDRLMDRLAARYPRFGWATNRGYGTIEHLLALEQLGPTRHHRMTFGPVAQLELTVGRYGGTALR